MHHACRSPSLSHDIIPGKQIKHDTLIFLLQMRIFLNKDFIYIYIHKTHKQDLFTV